MPICEVVSASADATAESGGTFSASWRVENDGIGRTNAVQWNDTVFVTSDLAGRNVVLSQSFNHLGALAAGSSSAMTAPARCPCRTGSPAPTTCSCAPADPSSSSMTRTTPDTPGAITVALAPSPNLQVTDIFGPAASLEGELVDISWTVRNNGQARAEGSWTDTVSLRKLGDPEARPIALGSYTFSNGLEANAFYTRTERIRLPAKLEGSWRLEVVTNAGNSLYEYGAAATNNFLADDEALLLSLKPRADLQIESLTGPDEVTAGGTVAVTFDVVNRGTVDANGQWFDAVYLSLDNKLGGDDILLGRIRNRSALQAGGDPYHQVSDTFAIPLRFAGEGFLIAVADIDNTVDEYPRDDNNVLTRAIFVNPYPPADLVVSNVVAPAQGVYGGEIEVRFTVTNHGSNKTDRETWTDTIWLARDRTRPTPGAEPSGNGGILLGTFTHTGHLEADASGTYDQVVKVRLPSVIESGTYYITPWTDAYDAVLETNFAAVRQSRRSVHGSTAAISRRGASTSSATRCRRCPTSSSPTSPRTRPGPWTLRSPCRWTVKNNAEGDALGDWADWVYASDTADIFAPNAKVWLLGVFGRPKGLLSGDFYTNQQTFLLSPALKANYITVYADGNPLPPIVLESNETNNTGVTTTSIASPISDLRVVSVTGPTSSFSGEKAMVTWTVTNDGAAVWNGTRQWTDSVYFSPDPVFIPSRAIQVGTRVHDNKDGLGAGASYTESLEVTLPRGIEGPYYLYVITDSGGTQPVTDAESGRNDLSRARYAGTVFEAAPTLDHPRAVDNRDVGTIPVMYREPDLKVSTLVVPPDPVSSGDLIDITFTVTNVGNRATREDLLGRPRVPVARSVARFQRPGSRDLRAARRLGRERRATPRTCRHGCRTAPPGAGT